MDSLWLLIIGMAVVTYIPRMFPLVLLQKIKLPSFIKQILEFIPYAALGALIFPGILSSTGTVQSAMLGGMVAIILAFYRFNLLLIVLSSILGVYLEKVLL
ncbi:AzlD domain-containing protein [Halanaerocella petrolearia]